MKLTLIGWIGTLLWGMAAVNVGYTIVTWGQKPMPVTRRLQDWAWTNEPLLSRLWKHLVNLMTGRGVERLAKQLQGFDGESLQRLVRNARHPLGLRRPAEIYGVGVLVGLVTWWVIGYMAGASVIWFALLPIILLGGISLVVAWLKIRANDVREQMVKEVWIMLSALEIYLGAGFTLESALEGAASAVTLLRGPILQAVSRCAPEGRERALDLLSRDLELPEAYMVLSAIRTVADQAPSTILPFLVREGARLEKFEEAANQKKLKLRPLMQDLILLIPAFNVVLVFLWPWLYAVAQKLEGVAV